MQMVRFVERFDGGAFVWDVGDIFVEEIFMDIKIALAGNPNSGKTTLFNALTGSNQFADGHCDEHDGRCEKERRQNRQGGVGKTARL